jgi:8-oxo-dGTP diphosphatase
MFVPMAGVKGSRTGGKAPRGYKATDYPTFAVTVDVVILTLRGNELSVLLVRRKGHPYAGKWALPGGFKKPNETLDQAVARELLEETGTTAPAHLAQLRAYGDPGRDPRTNVVTVSYLAVVRTLGDLLAGGDAEDVGVFPVSKVIDGDLPLAFEHAQIVADAVDRARADVEHTSLATAFVGPTFTLSQLRTVYESVWDTNLDPANFRRALTADVDYVEPTGATAEPGPEGGRPPELFRSTAAWQIGSPVKRPKLRSTSPPPQVKKKGHTDDSGRGRGSAPG